MKIPTDLKLFFDWEAAAIYLGWIAFQAFIYLLPIGRLVKGQSLRSGEKLVYRCNGKGDKSCRYQIILFQLWTKKAYKDKSRKSLKINR